MKKDTRNHPRISIGLDLGDRFSYMVAVDRKGEIVAEEGRGVTSRGDDDVFPSVASRSSPETYEREEEKGAGAPAEAGSRSRESIVAGDSHGGHGGPPCESLTSLRQELPTPHRRTTALTPPCNSVSTVVNLRRRTTAAPSHRLRRPPRPDGRVADEAYDF